MSCNFEQDNSSPLQEVLPEITAKISELDQARRDGEEPDEISLNVGTFEAMAGAMRFSLYTIDENMR